MAKTLKADICIIGAGSGGLSLAAGAAQLGLDTVLIERSKMGGECLNTGCVPSKALLAAAKRAQVHRKDDIKGIKAHEPEIDFAAVTEHISDTINAIAQHDSEERFERLGVTVIREHALFVSPAVVQAGESRIKARYFVVATGSRPVVPPVSGLNEEKVLTNETIFELSTRPEHLLIIGGGPIGIEMAQAFRRLGSRVSVFDRGVILPRDDIGNVAILRESLVNEGIDLFEHASIREVEHRQEGAIVKIEKDGEAMEIAGSHLLLAAGRQANTDGLDLEKAAVKYDKKGITTDRHLRTSNKKVFAIGDVAGGPQFTHVADYQAGVIIRQIVFKMIWAKVTYKALPWVTYTDPELAQVGVTEADARKLYGEDVYVAEWRYEENDRAKAERETNGQIRVVTDKKGRILGVSIVGAQAGELIGLWALVMTSGLKIRAVTDMIAPYPTLGEVSKRAASAWYVPRLFSNKTRRIVGFLKILPF